VSNSNKGLGGKSTAPSWVVYGHSGERKGLQISVYHTVCEMVFGRAYTATSYIAIALLLCF
jgi:hypothetical protein